MNTKRIFNYGFNLSLVGLASISGLSQSTIKAQEKPNILFIAIDDLKPMLGCYGDETIKTPNIDRLAQNGTVFLRNYCQQAVSGPTRASLMTGMRPDYTQVWDLKTRMRDVNPDILSLPQYFITQGYSTQGIGKVYDGRCVDKDYDKPSWSVPFYNYSKADKRYIASSYEPPTLGHYQSPVVIDLFKKYEQEAIANGIAKNEINNYVKERVFPSVECMDVPDNAYNDGANALRAKEILGKLKLQDDPFFFAVGFSKPHLPFVAPKKYWDMYDREKMPIASFQEMVEKGVAIAYHSAGELRNYSDIAELASTLKDQKGFGLTLPLEKQKELIHGYHATVSYIDAQVGMLLNTLDSLDLRKNTIVILWGDHGWHLGDHNLWCKHSNFEQATRTPLIISAPDMKPSVVKSPTEFVDIFPTLCELAGVALPSHLDGKSLVPTMSNPKLYVKKFAVSQYPRTLSTSETKERGFESRNCMGYSIRTERYRYTLWLGNNFNTQSAFNKKLVVGKELYDYYEDPDETVNLIGKKEHAKAAKKLDKLMVKFFKDQKRKFDLNK
jgi:iduronate 2-sulfatase